MTQSKTKTLTLQEKLALALTSYGNVSVMAKDIGITKARLTGWLREGEEPLIDPSTGETLRRGGVKKIPDDLFTKTAINEVFNAHKKRSKFFAKKFDLPFSEDYPVFQFKKARTDGGPSDRTFVIGTEYLSEKLRNKVLVSLASSRKYYSMVGRSLVNLHDYNKFADKRRPGWPPMTSEQKDTKRAINKAIREGFDFGPLYTKRIPLGRLGGNRWMSPQDYTGDYTDKLRERMEPCTGYEMAALSDQLIFQLIPKDDKNAKRSTKGKTRTRK